MTIHTLPKRVSILGAARSGLAAARYLLEHGVAVFISDTCEERKLDLILEGNSLAHVAHEGVRHTDRVLECDLIVLSPGVPSDLPILKKARDRGIAVWSEIELAFRQSVARYLAITGSSGKSTTTSLLGSIMAAAGGPSVVAGNIGIPLITAAPQIPAHGTVVAEISSFQLENIDTFKPAVAAILNLQKNHLDRYPGETEYYAAKKEIIRNMDKECSLVLNSRDPLLRAWAPEAEKKTNIVFFGAHVPGYPSLWHENGVIRSSTNGAVCDLLLVADMKLKGAHNIENAAAAAAMAIVAGVRNEHIAQGICSFEGLPHRLQFTAESNGVAWFNDSKSTTAESILCAVTAFADNVHLIAGGRDKGCDFSVVDDAVRMHVKTVTLIGEAAQRMQKQWAAVARITRAGTLEEAVGVAHAAARAGDVVVFSPGCSSFDMFSNYEERGESFMKIVKSITGTPGGGA